LDFAVLFFAVAEICKHSGIHLPDWVGVLFLPVIVYLWVYDWPGWKDLGTEEKKPNAARDSRKSPTDLPHGYIGPFWNKPSAAFLNANDQPFSASQKIFVCVVPIIPLLTLVFLLLRH
jgi:hypothetical protein